MGNLSRIVAAVLVSFFVLGGTQAGERWADSSDTHYESAIVTDVQPIVRVVQISTPREVCWDQQVRLPGKNICHQDRRGSRARNQNSGSGQSG